MKKIFGRKDKSDRGSPAPQDENPYARQPAEDPYANSPAPSSNYQPNRPMGLPSGPRPGGGGGGLPRGPAPARAGSNAPPPPYSSSSPQPGSRGPPPQQSSGYGNDRFGASGGYGGSRYDNGGAPFDNKQPRGGPQRQGGYGGLGSLDDDNRAGLFQDYKPPAARQTPGYGSGPDGRSPSGSAGGGYGQSGSAGGGYGGYGEDRELTEEEQQEMAVQDIKREIIDTQKATIASGQRSLQMVGAGTESAMNIAQALARQREHLDNAERNIDNSSVHNRIAKEQTKRLDKLNGSMFIPSGLNKKKLAELDERTRLSEQEEMRARDEARAGAYQGRMRMDGMMQDLQKPTTLGAGKANRSRREEFKFEDDDGEQEANNEEIDNQIDEISRGVSALHGAARMINEELEDQIRQVGRITDKSERANDEVRRNHTQLQRAARMN
ncbi:hypothetical protein B0T16DRAFT_384582 [Cercophora newfieldiana]|uniref:t-SNARE coiled-coil homology domain-containing protein n=1 Tax=Cercophora newfieldiana TaxID=92897 RepID=A0AA39YNE6_9PEZI|nr:hypothetical protein B0T16DRAFT_384582 [Cercophora newfieldiana]